MSFCLKFSILPTSARENFRSDEDIQDYYDATQINQLQKDFNSFGRTAGVAGHVMSSTKNGPYEK